MTPDRTPLTLPDLSVFGIAETGLAWGTKVVRDDEHGYLGLLLYPQWAKGRHRFVAVHSEMGDLVDDDPNRLMTRIARGVQRLDQSNRDPNGSGGAR